MRSLWIALLAALTVAPATHALAYVLTETDDGVPVAWNSTQVSWSVDASGTAELALASVEDAFQSALQAWDGVSDTDLTLAYGGTVSNVAVGYQPNGNINLVHFYDHGWGYSPDALAITLCTWSLPSGTLLDADIVVNTEGYDWSTDGDPSRFDLQSALTHEMGHAVGLGHSQDAEATMYTSMAPGELSKRDLDQDDIDGFRFLYGVAPVVQPDGGDPGTASDPGSGGGSDPGTDPGTDPTTDPTTDPGTDPTTDPGTDPTTDPGTDPQTDPGTDPGTDPQTDPGTDPSGSTDPGTDPSADPGTDPSADPGSSTTDPSGSTDPRTDPGTTTPDPSAGAPSSGQPSAGGGASNGGSSGDPGLPTPTTNTPRTPGAAPSVAGSFGCQTAPGVGDSSTIGGAILLLTLMARRRQRTCRAEAGRR